MRKDIICVTSHWSRNVWCKVKVLTYSPNGSYLFQSETFRPVRSNMVLSMVHFTFNMATVVLNGDTFRTIFPHSTGLVFVWTNISISHKTRFMNIAFTKIDIEKYHAKSGKYMCELNEQNFMMRYQRPWKIMFSWTFYQILVVLAPGMLLTLSPPPTSKEPPS